MSRPRVPKSTTDAIVAVTVADPELAARARNLGAQALDEVARIFREGHSTEKQALVRMMLPALMKTEKDTESDEMTELRASLDAVMKEAGLKK